LSVPLNLATGSVSWQVEAVASSFGVASSAYGVVFGVNHPPSITVVTIKVDVATSKSLSFLVSLAAEVTDPDTPYGDSISLSNGPVPSASWTILTTAGGSVTYTSGLVVNYTTTPYFNGFDYFTIYAIDSRGAPAVSGTLPVDVTNPSAACTSSSLTIQKSKAHPATITLAELGCPASGYPIVSVTDLSSAKSSATVVAPNIQLTVDPNRSGYVYFNFTLSSGIPQEPPKIFGETVFIQNHPPVFLSGSSAITVTHSVGTAWPATDLLSGVYDPDGDTVSITQMAGITTPNSASGPWKVIFSSANITIQLAADGQVYYNTASGAALPESWTGSVEISFTATDGDMDNVGSLSGTFTVTSS